MIILHIISGLNRGGAEECLYKLLQRSNSKFVFKIICLSQRGVYSRKVEKLGIKVFHLNIKNNFFAALLSLIKICRIIKTTKPDVVETWMYHSDLLGGLSAKIMRVKKIYWTVVSSSLDINLIGRRTYYVVRLCGLLSKLIPTRIITVARSAINIHTKVSYDKKKFIHIPIGFEKNYSIITEHENKIEKNLKKLFLKLKSENKFILANVARWDPHKNQLLLLQSLSNLKNKKINFFCILLGTGINYHNQILLNEMKKLNLDNKNILLIEELDNIDNFMKEIDLFVLTSLGEGMPNVIGEAMLNETPCVSSDVGDCAYLIGDTGWIFESNNVDQLSQKISDAYTLKNNVEVWNDLKSRCSKRINHSFSNKKMRDNYETLWTE